MKRLLTTSIFILFFFIVLSSVAMADTYSGGHNTSGASSPSNIWYFAEGYTGSGFEEWLCLHNPNSVSATVTVTYMFRKSGTFTQTLSLEANTRETISVNSIVGYDKEVSIKVESNKAIVAERSMYFNYQNKWQGGHNTIGATSTSTTWFFAEGYTGFGFEEWLILLNPNSSSATATITYLYRGGGIKTTTKTVPANSRETIDVNTDAGTNKELSVKVQSSQPLVAERAIYFDYQSMNYQNRCNGGHNTIGATSASSFWYFAEGYTNPLFDTWLTLQNPGETDATALITYVFRSGGTKTVTKTIPADSRETVYVNTDVGTNKEVSIEVQSTQPLIAERSMYFVIEEFCNGGHNALGTTSAGNQWYFAEGYTGEGFREWLTLQNPGGTDATASLTYMYRSGETSTTTKTIPANSRETIDVNTDAGTDKEVSIKITSTQPIIAERPMYFSYRAILDQGYETVADQLPLSQPEEPIVPEDEEIDWSQVDLIALLPQGDIPGYRRGILLEGGNSAQIDFLPNTSTRLKVSSLLITVRKMDNADQAKDFIQNTSKIAWPDNQKQVLIGGSTAYFGTNKYGYANLSWPSDVVVYEVQMLSATATPSGLYDDIVAIADYLP